MQNRVSNILVNQRVDILDTAFRRTWVVDKIQARSKFISYWSGLAGLTFGYAAPQKVDTERWKTDGK